MKPSNASGYRADVTAAQARAACLHLATILGDLLDQVTVVGGLVPSLLIDQNGKSGSERHVGTVDLDVALSVALLDDERYAEIAERLRRGGFEADINDNDNTTPQRWRYPEVGITVDFLIGAREVQSEPGTVKHLERGFGAFAIEGVELAFADREEVELDGRTLEDAAATRTVGVCGPGAFSILKARAVRLRGAGKDAYDLVYVLRNWPGGADEVASRIDRLRRDDGHGVVEEAIAWLRDDFAAEDTVGPVRAAAFDDEADDAELAAQAFAFVQDLLDALDRMRSE